MNAYHDPVQAIEAQQTTGETYDLAICDFSMPRMNGVELITALRKRQPDLPCILVTGNLDVKQQRGAELLPNLIYLHKPYSHEELMDAISTITHQDVLTKRS